MRRRILASLGKPLPYLRRVAYLESNGNQIMDSGVFARSNIDVRCKVSFNEIVYGGISSTKCVFGYYNRYGNIYALTLFDGGLGYRFNTKSSAEYDGHGSVAYGIGDILNVHSHMYDDVQFITVNGIKNGETHIAGGQDYTPYTYFMFGGKDYSAGIYFAFPKMRIYNMEIEIEEVLQKKFLPVLDLSGRPAMYDEVSGQLFYNKGTGEFTWGELGE